jgi:hypothetical protein
MDRSGLQEAVARILTSYLSTHKLDSGRLSQLVVSIGQALSNRPALREPQLVHPETRRYQRRAKKRGELEIQRIEHPDQPDMFNGVEAVLAEALIGETAGEVELDDTAAPDAEDSAEPETRSASKRGPRSGREIAETESETTDVDGVSVTRIPEVRRRRKR